MASLFADNHLGVYIPQYFAEVVYRDKVQGVTDEQYSILEAGPDHEWYWDTWNDVLNSARLVRDDEVGFLYQDGDLWVVWGDNDADRMDLMGEH